MQLNEQEFTEQFSQTLHEIMVAMAETPEIDPQKFFSTVCMLENLQFFSPVIFSALKKADES